MATITSVSTTAEITAAYLDNCGYEEDGSMAMAKAFVTACRAMLTRGIRVIDKGGERMEFATETLQSLITEAQRYARQNAGVDAGGAGTKFADLRDFRQ